MANNYWIKLYIEILDDPKMGRLTAEQWRLAIELFLLAGEQNKNGILPSLPDMAWRLRIDENELLQTMSELEQVGILSQDGDAWVVTNFARRQEAIPATERAKNSRKKMHRKQYYGQDGEQHDFNNSAISCYGNLPNKAGIYMITCKPTGRFYIGASKDIASRVKAQLGLMKTGGHALTDDFRLGGSDYKNVDVKVLELAENEISLSVLEKKYIDEYKNSPKFANKEKWGKNHHSWNCIGELKDYSINGDGNLDEATTRSLDEATSRWVDTDIDTEAEADKELTAAAGKASEINSSIAEIFKIYEGEIGIITSFVKEEILDAIEHYPRDWIIEAIKEAVSNNARNWNYVEAILKRWKAQGFKSDNRNKSKEKSKHDLSEWRDLRLQNKGT